MKEYLRWLTTRWYLYVFSFLYTVLLLDYQINNFFFFLGYWSGSLITISLFITFFVFINESYQKYKSTYN